MCLKPGNKEHLSTRKAIYSLLAGTLFIALSGCGSGIDRTASGKSSLYARMGVNDLSSDPRAAAAVAAQTETENGRAPGACVEILFNQPQDVFVNVSSESELHKMQAVICSLDEAHMTHMLKESHRRKGTRTDGFGLLFDVLTEVGRNKLDLNYNHTDAQSYDDQLAVFDARQIRHAFCNNQSAESFSTRAVESFKSVASEVTLDKYNACVRARSYGLRCDAVAKNDLVSALIRWEPTELVRSYLPRVALDWSGLVNLSAKDSLPKVIGIGSGISISLVKNNKNTESVLGVTASDASGQFSFACNMVVPLRSSDSSLRVLKRDPSCGVDLFREQVAPECGVDSYRLARSEACGIELHKEQRSLACGIERYNARHDCDICGQAGPFGGCRQCEHPMFGVAAYRSCRHVDHGAELYAECRHERHGVAQYRTCRRQEFGVERYKECLVGQAVEGQLL
jgi:hypothetical protein